MKPRRIPYSSEELAFIEARKAMSRADLHAEFVAAFSRPDVVLDHIKALCTRNGWTTRRRWSDADEAVLRAQYPDTPTAQIAAELNRSLSTTYQHAQKLGLGKSEAYLASEAACRLRRGDNVGAAFRFKKGQAPVNKGITGRRGWAPGRMATTQFTPGQPGWNWKPIGATRIIGGYEYTKVSDVRRVPYTVNWKPTHVLRWEGEHGALPDGHALKCLDSDRLNTDPANWEAVPRAMLPLLNGGRHGRVNYDEAPADLKPVVMTVARLKLAVNNKKGRGQKVSA